ncbi:MAG: hypothetical protein ABI947_16990 [Chloroflexota bacterium]
MVNNAPLDSAREERTIQFIAMLLHKITHEQQFLQHLWNKHRFAGLPENGQVKEQVQYVSQDGWSVLSYDESRQTSDVLFLGRTLEEAQQHLSTT